jgi:hypothetical protein
MMRATTGKVMTVRLTTVTLVRPLQKAPAELGDLVQKELDQWDLVQRDLSQVVAMTMAMMVRVMTEVDVQLWEKALEGLRGLVQKDLDQWDLVQRDLSQVVAMTMAMMMRVMTLMTVKLTKMTLALLLEKALGELRDGVQRGRFPLDLITVSISSSKITTWANITEGS